MQSLAGDLQALAARLQDPDPDTRLAAAEALVATDDPAAQPYLVRSLFDEDKRIKQKCGQALAKRGSPGLVALFERMLASDEAWLRETAAMGMGQFAGTALVPVLERVVRGPDATLAAHARASLERQAAKGNAAAMKALDALGAIPVAPAGVALSRDAGLAKESGSVPRAGGMPRGGAGRAREDSLGALRRPAATPADPYDLESAPAAPAAPPAAKASGPTPRRTRTVPAAGFDDMPPLAGPGVAKGASSGAQPALKDCPVCGDPAPVTAFRCPHCKEQLRADAPPQARPRVTGIDESRLAGLNARGCAHLVDFGYSLIFILLSGILPVGRGWGGAAYGLFKDGMPGGQSWGKAKYKCRVVDAATGQPATYAQSVLRNLPFALPGLLGVLSPGFTVLSFPVTLLEVLLVATTGIRIGDRIAGTRVVGGDPDASLVWMLGRLFLLGILVVAGFSCLISFTLR